MRSIILLIFFIFAPQTLFAETKPIQADLDLIDWTQGCIAVTNSEIEDIWKLVTVGTRVEIMP